MNVSTFLKTVNERFNELFIKSTHASWMANTTGDPKWAEESANAQTEYRRALSNPELFQQVKSFLDAGGLNDLEQRQLEGIYRGALQNQLPAETIGEMVKASVELSSIFNHFRGEMDGKKVSDNVLKNILKDSVDNAEREKAWKASKQIGSEVADKLLSLVKKRNEAARGLGFEDHHQMSFELQELDRDEVFGVFKKLKELSDAPFREIKDEIDRELAERFGKSADELRPWHYSDPFFQEAPTLSDLDLNPYYKGKNLEQITIDTFDSMGMDIRDMIAKSDLYEREGKNQHAFCTDLDREGDVRVLCNISDTEYWAETMLHEFGHAVYNKYVDRDLPFLLRSYPHILTTEAVAMFYGRMSKDPNWLNRFIGIPQAELKALAPKLEKALQRQMLISARWIITFVFFERELYANPDQDLNRLWWKLVEEIQFVNPPDETDYPHWAAKYHFANAPVYYQNYLLGELTASQFTQYIQREVSKEWFNPEAGRFFLQKVFQPGARYHWNTMIEQATGEPLNPEYFVKQFVK
jgi:oligoendopeptidase F